MTLFNKNISATCRLTNLPHLISPHKVTTGIVVKFDSRRVGHELSDVTDFVQLLSQTVRLHAPQSGLF